MDDLHVTITAETDQFQAEMNSAGASFNGFTNRVQDGVRGMNTSWTGHVGTLQGGIFAYKGLQDQMMQSMARMGALRQEIINTTDETRKLQLQNELTQESAKFTAARSEMRAMSYAIRDANSTAMLFEQTLGVHIPAGISHILMQLPQVRSAISSAFEVGIIVAAAGAVVLLIEKLGEASRALAGWGKEAQEKYAQFVKDNVRGAMEAVNLRNAVRDVGTGGAEGMAKLNEQTKAHGENVKDLGAATGTLIRGQQAQQAEYDRSTSGIKLWTVALTGWFDGEDQRINQLKEGLKGADAVIAATTENIRNLTTVQKKADAEAKRAEGIAEARANNAAKIAAEKDYGLAILAEKQKQSENMAAMGAIDAHQAIRDLITLENEKYAIQKHALERRLALAHTPAEKTTVTAETKTLDVTHRTTVESLGMKDMEETAAKERAIQMESLQFNKTVEEQKISDAEVTARRLHDIGYTTAEQETADLVTQLNARTTAERTYLEGEIAELEKQGTKTELQRTALHHRLLALDAQFNAEERALRLAGAESGLRDFEADARREQQGNDRSLRFLRSLNDERLRMGHETLREWVASEQAALQSWYSSATTTLHAEMAQEAAVHGTETDRYKQMVEQMKQLDRERVLSAMSANDRIAQDYYNKYSQITLTVSSDLGQMAMGHQTWAQTVMGWESKVLQHFLDAAAKRLARWLADIAKERVIHQAAKMAELAQDQTFSFAQQALQWQSFGDFTFIQGQQVAAHGVAKAAMTAQDTASAGLSKGVEDAAAKHNILRDAAQAAAKVFHKVMAALPFPIDVIVAPIAAAGVFMATLAFGGKFAQGGIVPGSGGGDTFPAMLSPQEMVLPPDISMGVQQMIAGGPATPTTSSPQGGGSFSMTYAPQVTAMDARGVSDVLASHSQDIARIVRNEMRRGRLPSYE